jgi:hypothetical protein
MKTIRVIVEERDYDVDFDVWKYDPKDDAEGDAVDADEGLFNEYVKLSDRLGELEWYFTELESPNYIKWKKERAAAKIKEAAHRKKCLNAVMADPGYAKAQEKLSNATNTK